MTATTTVDWHEANQRYLMARLSVVRGALSEHAAMVQGKEQLEEDERSEESRFHELHSATRALPGPAALDSLCSAFSLSPFERDLLLMCSGLELDSTFAGLCAAAQGDPQRTYPTFSLALAALAEAHWSALTPAAPLRRWRLIEVGLGDSLTGSPLRIDERILHYLAGASCLDARLHGLVEPMLAQADAATSHADLARQIAERWCRSSEVSGLYVINLCGEDHAGKRVVIASACALVGTQSYLLRAADIPTAVGEREALSRLWERETAITGSALLVDTEDSDNNRALIAFLENVRGVLAVASREPLRLCRRHVARVYVNKPNAAEQRQLWQEALGPAASRLDGGLEMLVSQFSLGGEQIRAASASALSGLNHAWQRAGDPKQRAEGRPSSVAPIDSPSEDTSAFAQCSLDTLWETCRAEARSRLDDLAQRIEPVAVWDDLVLPDSQHQVLRDVAVHLRQRARVYETWGFATKGARGLGISALFAGASGTGKTMAAEVLANELRLDLYRIDLSQVVNKYIGETEKNLRRVFDAAEEGGAILLFDEADALFGKRSEVKDSHDRYANIEISYLLQRMETYRGLAILTTNMKGALDTAFLRRLRFIVQFPFPDALQRVEIWRRIFPVSTPTENLDVNKLARLTVAGGNIRNIALSAAFLAADSSEPVRMFHLLRAARSEYAKMEKTLTDSEIREWV